MGRYGPRQIRHRRKQILLRLLLQVPVAWAAYRGLLWAGVPFAAVLLGLTLGWLNLGLLIWSRHDRPERPVPRGWLLACVAPFFVWHLVSAFACLPSLLLAGLQLSLPWWAEAAYSARLRSLLDAGLAALLLLCSGTALYAFAIRRRRVRVRTLDIALPGLPSAFDGYRIVQLSDFHIGNFTPPHWLRRWVESTRELAPDLVVLTGDYLTFGSHYLDACTREMGRLRAPDGVIACLGNHESFTDTERFVTRLGALGVRVLRNASHLVQRAGAELMVLGVEGAVDDLEVHARNLRATLGDTLPEQTTLLLAHDPSIFPLARERGIALTLSGHTHGGQIALPFREGWNPAALRYPHSSGLYRAGSSSLFVHRGLGTSEPPVRLGVAPEIAVLTIRCQAEAPAEVMPCAAPSSAC